MLGDRADVEVKNFIDALQENHRLTLLPEIARQFELLKSREESVVEATVESAFPLNDQQAQELAGTLKAKFGKDVRLSTSVDPDLIGGVRIKVGDDVIDASVRGKLQAMAVKPQKLGEIMQLNPSEISELIRAKIQNLPSSTEVRTTGTVVSVTTASSASTASPM